MINLTLLAFWCLMAFAAGRGAWRYVQSTYWTDWYDLSEKGPLQDLEWQQIRDVMDPDQDPLDHRPCWRGSCRRICRDLALVGITLLFFAGSYWLICDPDRLRPAVGNIGGLGLPAALAALAALGSTAVAVFYNVRLTARTNNRQAWINAVRQQLGNVIGNCIPQDGVDGEQAKDGDRSLATLELLINPSERVHRSVVAVVRLMHGIHDHPADRMVLQHLALAISPEQQMPSSREADRKCRSNLKDRARRLATVLLRREWEQVKHAR